MLTHIVVWKYKPEVGDEERREHVALLSRLPQIIPEIQSFAVGFDVHTRAGRVWKVGSSPGSDGEANGNAWTGWSHMILIVRLDGLNYFVEV